jgi:hypothetical protein
MCATNHDGTCSAVLSRNLKRPGQLIATLTCEHCNETLEVLDVYEYQVQPVDLKPAPELELTA